MEKYNKLTQRLLAEGYTQEHYPDCVRLDTGGFAGDEPLKNPDGGFRYSTWYSRELIYETGCGKLVKGENVLSGMAWQGIEWTHENDCPVINCPYGRDNCELTHELLRKGGFWNCVCHRTDKEYSYENSIEKKEKENRLEKQRKYEEFKEIRHGRICINHMAYNEKKKEWSLHYRARNCVRYRCRGYCPILGRKLDSKRGNVYYDLKESIVRHDGTLFDGEVIESIRKGIRFFEMPVSMDICRAFIEQGGQQEIWEKYRWNGYEMRKLYEPDFEAKIINVRAQWRPGRDLEQDLEDIRNGAVVIHDSDLKREQKEQKKQRREGYQKKKIEKLEKKILKYGYKSEEISEADRLHAEKWLGGHRISELEELRQKAIEEEKRKPVQMSLFDMIENGKCI